MLTATLYRPNGLMSVVGLAAYLSALKLPDYRSRRPINRFVSDE